MTIIKLPVYYIREYKTKPDKRIFIGMNWYRNAFHIDQNLVKVHMRDKLLPQLKDLNPITSHYQVTYVYHFKSPVSDLGNVATMASKWLNDTLQEKGIVVNDNVKYLKSEQFLVGPQNKEDPHIKIFIKEFKNDEYNEYYTRKIKELQSSCI